MLLTVIYLRLRQPPGISLQVADAFGLGLFALSGAQYAEAAHSSPMIIVLMGTMTGVTGGVIRDVITAKVPLILRREIYATAAIIGVLAYLGMKEVGVPGPYAFSGGILVVVGIRLVAIRWGLHLPVVHKP